MALTKMDARLFGLDLAALPVLWRDAWAQLLQCDVLRRCMPQAPLRVLGDGGDGSAPKPRLAWVRGATWHGPQEGSAHVADDAPYQAVLLPAEQALWRSLRLPATLPARALHAAVSLDVQTMSPFAPEHTLWAWAQRAAPNGAALRQIDIVITARHLVQQAIARSGAAPEPAPEVWVGAAAAGQPPLLLPGFGERLRLVREARQRLRLLLGCGVLAVLLAALAVTPSLQLRLRATHAQQQAQQLSQDTREAAALRQTLVEEAEGLQELLQRQAQQIDHVQVLAALTDVLPDHTAVQMIQFRGPALNVQGLSDNASEVVNLLGQHPGFRDVRLPSAVTRAPRSNKDHFTLQAEIDPAFFALHPQVGPPERHAQEDAP